jgi:hypothetical protein
MSAHRNLDVSSFLAAAGGLGWRRERTRLIAVYTRSGVNPAPQVDLSTEVVHAQRLGSGGRANAPFDQVCVGTYVYACMCVKTGKCVCVCVCVCVEVYACMCVQTDTCVCVCVCV